MLDSDGVRKYWEKQTEKGDNPCHYHNKWQDKYAFEMRTGALRTIDFTEVKEIVDVGCGIGEYTNEITTMTDAHISGFDFPFNIKIAKEKFAHLTNVAFFEGGVPDEIIREKMKGADLVLTTTVFVHFSPEARQAFYMYAEGMKRGSRVVLLEYIPEVIPEFQKNLEYKKVQTVSEIAKEFETRGFSLSSVRHINFVDSFLFHHLGTNAFVYCVTKIADTFLSLIGYTKSKYKMLTFKKN